MQLNVNNFKSTNHYVVELLPVSNLCSIGLYQTSIRNRNYLLSVGAFKKRKVCHENISLMHYIFYLRLSPPKGYFDVPTQS